MMRAALAKVLRIPMSSRSAMSMTTEQRGSLAQIPASIDGFGQFEIHALDIPIVTRVSRYADISPCRGLASHAIQRPERNSSISSLRLRDAVRVRC